MRYPFVLLLILLLASLAFAETPAADVSMRTMAIEEARESTLFFDQTPNALNQQTLWQLFVPDASAVMFRPDTGETTTAVSWLLSYDVLGTLDNADMRDLWLDLVDPIPGHNPAIGASLQIFPASPFAAGIYYDDGKFFTAMAGHTSW